MPAERSSFSGYQDQKTNDRQTQDTRRTNRLWNFVLELWDVASGDAVCGRTVQQRVDAPPPAASPVDGDEEGTDPRCTPTRPRLHCTEDLCHQSGGIARRTRPEKHAPSVRPTHAALDATSKLPDAAHVSRPRRAPAWVAGHPRNCEMGNAATAIVE